MNGPISIAPGTIVRDAGFYSDDRGRLRAKFFLVLAEAGYGDVVVRLLTSRPHGRATVPRCSHGAPYPSFHLGVLGGRLDKESWLDLRALDEMEAASIIVCVNAGHMAVERQIDPAELIAAIECTAGAPDTTRAQERALWDQHASLKEPGNAR